MMTLEEKKLKYNQAAFISKDKSFLNSEKMVKETQIQNIVNAFEAGYITFYKRYLFL